MCGLKLPAIRVASHGRDPLPDLESLALPVPLKRVPLLPLYVPKAKSTLKLAASRTARRQQPSQNQTKPDSPSWDETPQVGISSTRTDALLVNARKPKQKKRVQSNASSNDPWISYTFNQPEGGGTKMTKWIQKQGMQLSLFRIATRYLTNRIASAVRHPPGPSLGLSCVHASTSSV